MADIFISYAREDRSFTELLASRLEERGWSVWWDRRIPAGKRFEKVIEEELHGADCVIAVWSRQGIASHYVREEAADGRDRDVLVPVFAEAVEAPFGFRSIHAADLRGWNGDPAHAGFLDLINDISGRIGPPRQSAEAEGAATTEGSAAADARPERKREETRKQALPALRKPVLVVLALLLVAGAAAWLWAESRSPSAPGTAAATKLEELIAAVEKGAATQPKRAPGTPAATKLEELIAAVEKGAATQKSLAAGDVFRDCDVCPEMVALPAGQFLMGSPDGEKDRDSDEGPQHEVTIKPFAIGKYEVTFEEWDACVQAGGCNGYRPGDQSWGRGKRPVINVSWRDAQAYVAWLSGKTGQSYRLPSEAEWEYVARAGTTTRYAFGDEIVAKEANFGSTIGKTTAVGAYPPNRWGLFDMHGNVLEWVEDVYHDGYKGAPSDGTAWTDGEGKDFLPQPRLPGRFLELLSEDPPLREPRQDRSRLPLPRSRVPRRPDA
jgi:formylglycine-generating enzyme required for sulfatase activity